MLLSTPHLAVLLTTLASLTNAKYFSDGWKPGQPTQRVAVGQTGPGGFRSLHNIVGDQGDQIPVQRVEETVVVHDRPQSTTQNLVISSLNTVASLTGINFTQAYITTKEDEYFSRVNDTKEGFIRLTDGNLEDELVMERFWGGDALKQEKERVWAILVHGPPRDPASRIFYEAWTNASVASMEAGDLPNVKWARMDFVTEWKTCARWMIFKPPFVVFATDRGSSLRFIASRQIQPTGDVFRRFMREEIWKELPVWKSEWSPGGSRTWVIAAYIYINTLWTKLTAKVPGWMILIGSGLITQSVLSFLHKGDPAAQKKHEEKQKALKAAEEEEKSTKTKSEGKSTATAVKGSGSSTPRKGGKAGKADKDGVKVTMETKKVK